MKWRKERERIKIRRRRNGKKIFSTRTIILATGNNTKEKRANFIKKNSRINKKTIKFYRKNIFMKFFSIEIVKKIKNCENEKNMRKHSSKSINNID